MNNWNFALFGTNRLVFTSELISSGDLRKWSLISGCQGMKAVANLCHIACSSRIEVLLISLKNSLWISHTHSNKPKWPKADLTNRKKPQIAFLPRGYQSQNLWIQTTSKYWQGYSMHNLEKQASSFSKFYRKFNLLNRYTHTNKNWPLMDADSITKMLSFQISALGPHAVA